MDSFAIANIQLLETTNLPPTLSAEPCVLWSHCTLGAYFALSSAGRKTAEHQQHVSYYLGSSAKRKACIAT